MYNVRKWMRNILHWSVTWRIYEPHADLQFHPRLELLELHARHTPVPLWRVPTKYLPKHISSAAEDNCRSGFLSQLALYRIIRSPLLQPCSNFRDLCSEIPFVKCQDIQQLIYPRFVLPAVNYIHSDRAFDNMLFEIIHREKEERDLLLSFLSWKIESVDDWEVLSHNDFSKEWI